MTKPQMRAYSNGHKAFMDGKSIDSCPYRENMAGFSNVYFTAWRNGYQNAEKGIPDTNQFIENKSVTISLPAKLLKKIGDEAEKTGISKSGIIKSLIEEGLNHEKC